MLIRCIHFNSLNEFYYLTTSLVNGKRKGKSQLII